MRLLLDDILYWQVVSALAGLGEAWSKDTAMAALDSEYEYPPGSIVAVRLRQKGLRAYLKEQLRGSEEPEESSSEDSGRFVTEEDVQKLQRRLHVQARERGSTPNGPLQRQFRGPIGFVRIPAVLQINFKRCTTLRLTLLPLF